MSLQSKFLDLTETPSPISALSTLIPLWQGSPLGVLPCDMPARASVLSSTSHVEYM